MSGATELTPVNSEVLLLSLAREIAQDILPIETILSNHKIDRNQFETIAKLPRFQALLSDAITAWTAAQNTGERVKLKTLSSIEESLPQLHADLNDQRHGLNHRVELLKAMARIAGLSERSVDTGGAGERVSITINMGADKELKVAADLPARVIEGEIVGAEP